MNIQGFIFDFNGTLFWDTEYQNSSWDEYLLRHNISLTEEEKRTYVHGRNGKDTFEYLFKREVTEYEAKELMEDKEIIYRNICIQNKMELAPGAESLIKYLLDKKIKIAIATAAGKSNVDFFIEKFDLFKYFNEEHIIFNDGTSRGKPHPDLFNKAIKSLDICSKNAIIFEDSFSGIKAAENAKPGKVVIVNSANENYENFPHQVINHFDQFDRTSL